MECLRNAYLTCQPVSEVKGGFSPSSSSSLSLKLLFACRTGCSCTSTNSAAALRVRAQRRRPCVSYIKPGGRRGQKFCFVWFPQMWVFYCCAPPTFRCELLALSERASECRRQCLSTGVLPAVKQNSCKSYYGGWHRLFLEITSRTINKAEVIGKRIFQGVCGQTIAAVVHPLRRPVC